MGIPRSLVLAVAVCFAMPGVVTGDPFAKKRNSRNSLVGAGRCTREFDDPTGEYGIHVRLPPSDSGSTALGPTNDVLMHKRRIEVCRR